MRVRHFRNRVRLSFGYLCDVVSVKNNVECPDIGEGSEVSKAGSTLTMS